LIGFSEDEDLIRQLHERWIEAEREGRQNDLLALCTPGIIMQPPIGRAVVGQSEVAAFLAASQEAIEAIDISALSIEVTHDLAIKRARFSTRISGCGSLVAGTHLWLLRPRWQVAFVTWSLDALPD